MKCRGEVYTASARAYTGLPELTYPFHDRDIVTARGRLCLHRKKINISTVLAVIRPWTTSIAICGRSRTVPTEPNASLPIGPEPNNMRSPRRMYLYIMITGREQLILFLGLPVPRSPGHFLANRQ
jgi:hypothetical protein